MSALGWLLLYLLGVALVALYQFGPEEWPDALMTGLLWPLYVLAVVALLAVVVGLGGLVLVLGIATLGAWAWRMVDKHRRR